MTWHDGQGFVPALFGGMGVLWAKGFRMRAWARPLLVVKKCGTALAGPALDPHHPRIFAPAPNLAQCKCRSSQKQGIVRFTV